MDGVVVVDKPQGITSHDVVDRIRRLFETRRVGHAGTLDPLATGVLAVCIGQATRIVEYLTAGTKEYVAEVVFGVTTNTQDSTGSVRSERDAAHLTEGAVRDALASFRGKIVQTPPMVSAAHYAGRRLYELARQGLEVEREARPVEIFRLEMTRFVAGVHPTATLEIACSTGTYIRALAADIGERLGVGGMMNALVRTRAGGFSLKDARTLEQLEALRAQGALRDCLRSIAEALSGWLQIVVTEEEERRIRQGQRIRADHVRIPAGSLCLLLNGSRRAVAVARAQAGHLAPIKVLAEVSRERP
jgi:tRNA pseudouridine55 synthase